MASTSGCSHQLLDLQLSNTPCTMNDASKKSEFARTTLESEVDHATPLTSYFSVVEDQIEQSKAHWSTLADHSDDTDDEVNFEVSNEREFRALQRHPIWGCFFGNFTGDGRSTSFDNVYGELVVGKKFAEGGQAELFEAQIKWDDPENAKSDRREGREYVLKVFKERALLKYVKFQMPKGLLQFRVELLENLRSPMPKVFPEYISKVYRGILLKNGRFAFLMRKEKFDLRTLIVCNVKLRSGEDCGPFPKEEVGLLMYDVALGVDMLHSRDIVHRDLKASNVLVYKYETDRERWNCYVADYECSIGVIGTDFFRAPEILQACKERKLYEKPELFSKASDVYSYGMTCYEILTGKLPFEDHPLSGSLSLLKDLVINQHLRPEVPTYVEGWARELLDGCWQANPKARPRIEEVLNVLSANLAEVRRFEVWLKKQYGENFRS